MISFEERHFFDFEYFLDLTSMRPEWRILMEDTLESNMFFASTSWGPFWAYLGPRGISSNTKFDKTFEKQNPPADTVFYKMKVATFLAGNDPIEK